MIHSLDSSRRYQVKYTRRRASRAGIRNGGVNDRVGAKYTGYNQDTTNNLKCEETKESKLRCEASTKDGMYMLG